MPNIKLHLDSDTSRKIVYKTLLKKGHDVTRTPNEWVASDDSDEMQLLGSTAQGRVLFTFNIKDFVILSTQYPQHAGIVLTHQNGWSISTLIDALDRLLKETTKDDWTGQVRWLNDWG